jgi:hypothetical protein
LLLCLTGRRFSPHCFSFLLGSHIQTASNGAQALLLQFSIFLGIVMVVFILELTMTMLCRCCSVILSTLSSFLRVDLCCTSWYLLDNLCQLSAPFQSLPIQRTRFYHKNYGIFYISITDLLMASCCWSPSLMLQDVKAESKIEAPISCIFNFELLV